MQVVKTACGSFVLFAFLLAFVPYSCTVSPESEKLSLSKDFKPVMVARPGASISVCFQGGLCLRIPKKAVTTSLEIRGRRVFPDELSSALRRDVVGSVYEFASGTTRFARLVELVYSLDNGQDATKVDIGILRNNRWSTLSSYSSNDQTQRIASTSTLGVIALLRKRQPIGEGGYDEPGSEANVSDGGSPEYGSAEYSSTEYGSSEYGSSEYGSSDGGSPEYGSTERGSSDGGAPEYGSSERNVSDGGAPEYGSKERGSSDRGESNQVPENRSTLERSTNPERSTNLERSRSER